MERTLISWNVPNVITIWAMLFIGFFLLALLCQFFFRKAGMSASGSDDTSGGY